jgi:hypothetical protein
MLLSLRKEGQNERWKDRADRKKKQKKGQMKREEGEKDERI